MLRFVREDTPTIMDGPVVRYRLGFHEISASRNGVGIHMHNFILTGQETVDAVIRQIIVAKLQHRSLERHGKPLDDDAAQAMVDEELRAMVQRFQAAKGEE